MAHALRPEVFKIMRAQNNPHFTQIVFGNIYQENKLIFKRNKEFF